MVWILGGLAVVLLWAGLALRNLNRSKISTYQAIGAAQQRAATDLTSREEYAPTLKGKPASLVQEADAAKQAPEAPGTGPDATAGRKIIGTSSMEMVVQHPADVADRITMLADKLGGYLVSADGGGQAATVETLTIRVPAGRFEEARTEIRKLGLRVEGEKIEARDVTRQSVDQDASIHNLRAEESQYLMILKQASSVKDLLMVSQRLSEVRGQIEQQQPEFNVLSQQIETVSLAVSLRAEAEAQVFGLASGLRGEASAARWTGKSGELCNGDDDVFV